VVLCGSAPSAGLHVSVCVACGGVAAAATAAGTWHAYASWTDEQRAQRHLAQGPVSYPAFSAASRRRGPPRLPMARGGTTSAAAHSPRARLGSRSPRRRSSPAYTAAPRAGGGASSCRPRGCLPGREVEVLSEAVWLGSAEELPVAALAPRQHRRSLNCRAGCRMPVARGLD
jgi:hypothetical protein